LRFYACQPFPDFSAPLRAVTVEYPLSQHVLDGLKKFQTQLGLKENDVNRIERPIIDSKENEYRQKLEAEKIKQKQEQLKCEQERIDYQINLQKYEQDFSKAVKAEYPLSQHILDGLEKFQKQLGLKKDDVTRIEKSIREPLEAKYQQQLKEKKLAVQQRQLELEQKVQKKAKHENNLQHYEQEFSKAVKAEYPLSQHVLDGLKNFQKQMNITDEDVSKIEKPIIGKLDFQYQQQLRMRELANEQMKAEIKRKRQKDEHEKNLQSYEKEFSKAVKAEYPLSQHVLDGLKNFQKQIALTDEDVAKIQKPIIKPLEAKYQQQIKQKEHKSNLLHYEHQLSRAIQMEYPLSQHVLDGLKIFQQQLGLTDKDIAIAKQKVEAQQHQKRQEAIVHYNLGIDLYQQNKLDDAIIAYRRAIQIDPNYANAHAGLGCCLLNQGKLDEAIISYRKTLKINPNDSKTYNNLGNALYDQGKFDDAINTYRKAIELDPNNAVIHNNLESVLKKRN
jgi:tetratricopeptide (TPR) repeat protein